MLATDRLLCESGEERFKAPTAIIALPVNKEARSSVNSCPHSGPKIFPNPVSVDPGGDFLKQAHFIEIECEGISRQGIVVEGILILEEGLMHLKKSSLFSSGLGGFGRMFSMGMNGGQWKVPIGKTEIITQAILNFFNDWLDLPAERTLVISIFEQGDRGFDCALKMIASGVGNIQRAV
jgi:hypothetical protein